LYQGWALPVVRELASGNGPAVMLMKASTGAAAAGALVIEAETEGVGAMVAAEIETGAAAFDTNEFCTVAVSAAGVLGMAVKSELSGAAGPGVGAAGVLTAAVAAVADAS
jgi:hypothetical protein